MTPAEKYFAEKEAAEKQIEGGHYDCSEKFARLVAERDNAKGRTCHAKDFMLKNFPDSHLTSSK